MTNSSETKPSLSRKLLIILAGVGPGLFLIGYNIGTGSITTMAITGAEHGMKLFWVLVISCLFTYVMLVAYDRYSLVTGKTSLRGIRTEIRGGWAIALYLMIALILGELMSLMGIMGIVSDLLREGSRLLFGGEGWGTLGITSALVVGLYALFWYGRYQIFEKILTVFVILMGLSFVTVFFMVRPEMSVIAEGLIPGLPEKAGGLGLIAAIAGTTCSAAVFIMRSVIVSEKGWGAGDLKQAQRDAAVSSSVMLFLSAAIMAVAAGTLFTRGISVRNTVDMIGLMEPLGGKVAAFILIVGVASAGISTVFPIVLIAPWLIADFTGRPRNIRSPLFRILGLVGILFGFGMQFLDQRPPAVMVFAQGFQACILPVVVIVILVLLNRESTMGNHRARTWMNVGLTATLAFGVLTTYFAIVDLKNVLRPEEEAQATVLVIETQGTPPPASLPGQKLK